jgi:hypothetical protein
MPAEDVDRPSLAEHVERELEFDLPASVAQESHHELDQGRVRRIDEPVREPSAITESDDEIGAELGGDPLERADGHTLQPAGLCARVDGLADAGAIGDLSLCQSKVEANGSQGPSDICRIHRVQHDDRRSPVPYLAFDAASYLRSIAQANAGWVRYAPRR